MALARAIAAISSLGATFAACDFDACEEDFAAATNLLQAQIVATPRHSSLSLGQISLHGSQVPELPPNLEVPGFNNVHLTDMNGKICSLCDLPLPERSDREYVQRTDCGNHSMYEHPEVKDIPAIQFKREAKDGQPATIAWCEFNLQRVCADSIVNKDYLMQAKSVDYPASQTYDLYYCKHNGWLSKELKALQHDFEGMDARAEQECSTRQYESITMNQMEAVYRPGMERGQPTKDEALFIGSWTCAMGDAACDMAYCAYSFCELPDGTIGRYGECEGWDPVQGMPA
jgi:hypothetical protein